MKLFINLSTLCLWILFVCSQTQNLEIHKRRRYRQVEQGGPQIDLNITVPYIFSARLYPYGPNKEDKLVQVDPTAYNLRNPLIFLGNTYNSIFVHKDGFVSFESDQGGPSPIIAVFWMRTKTGKVYFRETTDPSILNVAQNEVNIQFRYGSDFRPASVLIITWENNDGVQGETNTFQLALILGDNASFAHIVYSKLDLNNDAVAGFTSDDETSTYFALPGSGTSQALQLVEKSNIGIPGEWLFRIDAEQIHLCGAGFQGLECVDSCLPTQWYLDCSKQCHCADGSACNTDTGECPDAVCSPGWRGAPVCDEDIDECAGNDNICPDEQPDCVNTAGAYLCLCFEYDNATNSCVGSRSGQKLATIAVPVMPLHPQLPSQVTQTTRQTNRRTRPFVAPQTTPIPPTRAVTTTTTPAAARAFIKKQDDCQQCDPHARCLEGRCQCTLGWKGNGKICEDVDECSSASTCGSNAECANTMGSYQCICNVGFIATETGCKDVDECEEGIASCKDPLHSICVNNVGGYECRCKVGYTGHPDSGCVDIDECQNTSFHCGPKASCKNSVGNFSCECLEGYEKVGAVCTDINECLFNPCDTAAVCSNVEGTFKCECVEGFVGDGVQCHETILYQYDHLSTLNDSYVVLNYPVNIFGKKHDKMYISKHGAVSFEAPFDVYSSIPSEVRSPGLYPLYRGSPLTSNKVKFVEIDEDDAGNYSLLTRASLTIQEKFKQNDFRAKSLYIITFLLDPVLTYQVIISEGKNATFVTYLYEKLESIDNAVAGISYPQGFINIPVELLAQDSNIGQTGKWVYRVDLPNEVIACPAGQLGAPLCKQDCRPGTWGFNCKNDCHCSDGIPCDFGNGYCATNKCMQGYRGSNCFDDVDECKEGLSRCHPKADCANSFGSYKCNCQEGYFGDGFDCVKVDTCQLKNGEKCSSNGYCQTQENGVAACVCNPGFTGDGKICFETAYTEGIFAPTRLMTTPFISTIQSIDKEKPAESSEQFDEHPFVMNNWVSSEKVTKQVTSTTSTSTTTTTSPQLPSTSTTAAVFLSNFVNPAVTQFIPRQKSKPTTLKPVAVDTADDKDDLFELDNKLLESSVDASNHNYDADDSTSFIIILPAALCIIWLLLMAILLAVCCRKRQRTRANKYNLEMMGWTTREYTSPRNSQFSHFAYT